MVMNWLGLVDVLGAKGNLSGATKEKEAENSEIFPQNGGG